MMRANLFLVVFLCTRDQPRQTRNKSRQSAQSLIIGLISLEKSLSTS